jgi:hypothetical protein
MRLIGSEIEQIEQDTAKVIYLAVPTFGQVSIEWHTHMMLLQNPLNKSVFHGCVRGTEVGTARNILVDQALNYRHPGGLTVSHVLFVDDDCLVPPYALTRLLSHKRPIVSGLYFAKTDSPQPLMLRGEYGGLVESWTPGEMVECDGHGMGCTLIETRVFRDVAASGLVGTELWHGREIAQFFKTTRDDFALEDGSPKLFNQTEDMYFLSRARSLGHQPSVDTGCFVWHWDESRKTAFPLKQWQEFRTVGTVTWDQAVSA